MNLQLVKSLIQAIRSLAADLQLALAGKILTNLPYPLTRNSCSLPFGRLFYFFE